ncbi:RCC1/BLIP-II protein, partial [Fragilariopsis cylindrus CCMP1102]
MNRIKQVSCGIDHTAAITETKSVLTWGSNTYGQLETGDLLFFPLPQQNSVLKGVPLVGISAGLQHAVVWTAFGAAYAWG